MKIYLSGAMEKVTLGEGRTWRNLVKERLGSKGIILFDPYDFEKIHTVGSLTCIKKLVETDKFYISKSDLVIVNTSKQGVGTPQEVLYAYTKQIPVWMFGGSVNPWYLYHVQRQFDTLTDLMLAVEKLYASEYASECKSN